VCAAVVALMAIKTSEVFFAETGKKDLRGPQTQVGTPELLLDQAKREFDAFHNDQVVPLLDQVIAKLTAGGQNQKPELLTLAYELRARARFNLGDSAAAEQDFSALLLINPGYKLSEGISVRVRDVFESVRKLTVGQLNISMTPEGDVQIDGKAIPVAANSQLIDLPVGEHTVAVARPGYRAVSQKVNVVAGDVIPIVLTLERVSSTLAVISIPEAVDVLLDGTPKGQTTRIAGASDGSATLLLTDLQTGPHRVQLRRDCYKEVEKTITIEQHGDLKTEPLKLVPAVASVTFQTTEPNTMLVVDGVTKGLTPPSLPVCEGLHVIEVRGPKGRFVDRREWKTGDAVTLTADLRAAFPIVASRSGAGLPVEQLRSNIAAALASVKSVLIYTPADTELTAAMRDASVPPDWLAAELGAGQAVVKVPKEVKRDLVKKLTTRMQVQGLAAISSGQDPYLVTVLLFAAGSGEPDLVTVNLADAAARAKTLEMLAAPLPPMLRPSLETSVVDLAGVQGAVVIRADGVGAKMGLEAGDVIVAASASPIKSVADLRNKIATMRPGAADISLDVKKGPGGAQRTVTGSVAMVPETLPLQDQGLLYNRALITMQDMPKTGTAMEQSALHVNLAIVMMRLGNWEDALVELAAAKLPDGAGVSAGTVAYLTGRCEEALGHAANATAAYTKAAASPKARLSSEGPLVAPLALQKLRPRGGG
jgi:hypothetical protein